MTSASKRHMPIEETEVFKCFQSLANEAWRTVEGWSNYAQWSVGKQLTGALDSVGANLCEGDGRFSDGDALHFFVIARGSAREARYWVNAAHDRGLISDDKQFRFIQEIDRGLPMLNGLINYRRETKNQGMVKEERADYGSILGSDPNAQRPTPNAQRLTPNA